MWDDMEALSLVVVSLGPISNMMGRLQARFFDVKHKRHSIMTSSTPITSVVRKKYTFSVCGETDRADAPV
jgi:hypothetical protein